MGRDFLVPSPYDEVPEQIDYSVQLTDHEKDLISSVVEEVIKNIFRREKDIVKRRILVSCIGSFADYQAAMETTRKVHNIQTYLLRKKRKEEEYYMG